MENRQKELSYLFLNSVPEKGHLNIAWIGQSGFIIKLPTGTTIAIDLYLSSCLTRMLPEDGIGYTRMMPVYINPEDIAFDYIFVSHCHYDHLDIDSIGALCSNGHTRLYCPDTSAEMAEEYGVDRKQIHKFNRGDVLACGDFKVKAVTADHGDMCADAIGLLFDFGFTTLYFAGDTALTRELLSDAYEASPEISILPINGAFGNLNSREAAILAKEIHTKKVIPCHFWMCPYHHGDPGEFIRISRETCADDYEVKLLIPGTLNEI